MFGGSEAAGEKAELLGAADGTRYGWLAARRGEQRGQKREKEDPFEGARGDLGKTNGPRRRVRGIPLAWGGLHLTIVKDFGEGG